MMPWWNMWSGGFWIFPVVGMTFMLVIVFVFLRAVFGRPPGAGWWTEPRPPESALDIARRRYASGEISREAFEQIRKDLEARP